MQLYGLVVMMMVHVVASSINAAPFMYVTNSADNTISVIDTATNTVLLKQ